MPRFLIVSPNWVGDAVMAQSLLQLLKSQNHVSSIRIDVLAPPAVAAVWRAVPEVNDIIEAPFRHGALEWQRRRMLASELKKNHYQQAYVLPNSLKSALIPWLAGIPKRIGYQGEMRYGLLNTIHHDNKSLPRPMVSLYAALSQSPSKHYQTPQQLPKPVLQVRDDKRLAALDRFTLSTQTLLIIFAPGAEFGAAKRWPPSHFATLAQLIRDKYPAAKILLMGSPKDQEICSQIAALQKDVINLAGATSLDVAIALIASAAAVVSNDSGILHIASALNRPVIGLYGPTDPTHAPPFSTIARVVHLQLACMPCRQRECPLGHHDCMQKLGAPLVWKQLSEILA